MTTPPEGVATASAASQAAFCPECGNLPIEAPRGHGGEKVYCSDRCRSLAYHRSHPRVPVQNLDKERKARDKGMELSAAKNEEYLALSRAVAEGLALTGPPISIDHVRAVCEEECPGIVWGAWTGSVFKGKQWERVGYCQARHKGSHARVVGVWRLKQGAPTPEKPAELCRLDCRP